MNTKNILIAALSLLPAVALADVTRNFSVAVQGDKSASASQAKISYLDACEKMRAEIGASGLEAFVQTASCAPASLQEGTTLYQASGRLDVNLKRPMSVDVAPLGSGFSASEAEARDLWNHLCTDWKQAAPQSLFASCGEARLDSFYVKPEITSTAVRVQKIRVPVPRGEYCRCRERTEEVPSDYPGWHRPVYRTFYDLMVLNDEGFYEKQQSFSSPESCDDELVRAPVCSAD